MAIRWSGGLKRTGEIKSQTRITRRRALSTRYPLPLLLFLAFEKGWGEPLKATSQRSNYAGEWITRIYIGSVSFGGLDSNGFQPYPGWRYQGRLYGNVENSCRRNSSRQLSTTGAPIIRPFYHEYKNKRPASYGHCHAAEVVERVGCQRNTRRFI